MCEENTHFKLKEMEFEDMEEVRFYYFYVQFSYF